MLRRFLHTVTAAWLSGGMLMLGIGAWYLGKGRKPDTARKMMGIALSLCVVTAIIQPLWGHNQIMEVIRWQGPKSPAMEGIFQTQAGASLYGVGFVDVAAGKTYGLGIPGGLSFLESGSFTAVSKGLNDFPKDQWPAVQTVFQSFHFMVLIGVFMIALLLIHRDPAQEEQARVESLAPQGPDLRHSAAGHRERSRLGHGRTRTPPLDGSTGFSALKTPRPGTACGSWERSPASVSASWRFTPCSSTRFSRARCALPIFTTT